MEILFAFKLWLVVVVIETLWAIFRFLLPFIVLAALVSSCATHGQHEREPTATVRGI